jgi:L-asparaginase
LHFITLKHLDSNFIDEAYRQNVRRLIEEAAEREVLITHGTDTILVTADYFFRQREASPALRDKVILLTGSMIALSCGPESDGFHNIRFSLEQLSRSLPSGVYVVLSDYDDVQAETGWSPRLYRYQPKKFGKTHDVSKMNRDRMFVLTEQE